MGGVVLLVGKLSFALIGLAVGVKIASSAREDGLGLHLVALAAICVGGVGLLAMPAAKPLESVPLALLGEFAVRGAMLLLCVFIAGTFRPGPGGAATALACGGLLIATMVWDLLAQPSLLQYDYTEISSHANQLSVAAPFAWSAAESGMLWSRARRRLALGLSDALLVNRYLLWSVTTACFVGIALLAVAGGLALSAGAPVASDLAQGGRGLLYLVITACVWRGLFAVPSRETSPGSAARA